MKPNFALSLSFDGIQLLHRATGGWRLVGQVALDAKNLKSDLAKLKQKAEKLGAGPIRCKLIVPDEQIKYLELDSGSGDAEARRQQARSALDGATPYVLSDLEFDISLDGKKTHVAAVARETLDEAEAFAVDHGFGPISFVAAPNADETSYLGEPFFGTTRWVTNILSKGDTVVQDGIAVVNIGPIEDEDNGKTKPAKDVPAATPVLKSAVDASPKADTSFASVRGSRGTDDAEPVLPKPRKVDDGMSASSIPIPKLTPAVEPSQTPPKPRFTISPSGDATAGTKALTPPVLNGSAAQAQGLKAPQRPAISADKVTPKATPPAKPIARPNGVSPIPSNAKASQINSITPSNTRIDADAERRNLTIFGERPSDTKVGGKPRYLGLMLTSGLVLFLAGVAAYAALFMDKGVSGLWSDDNATIAAVEPLVDPEPEAQPQPVEPQDPDPVVTAIEAPQPIEVPTEEAAPVLEIDPVVAALTPEPTVEPVVEPAQDPVVEPEPVAVETPVEPTPEATREPVQEQTVLTDTDTAVLDALRDTGPTEPLTLESAQTAYSVTGIWQMPPTGGVEQTRVDIGDVYVASIDTNTATPDLFSLPAVETLGTDAALDPIALPPPAGLSFKLDERGLVFASPEGTLSPQGILIFSGRPKIVPPPTPERAAAVEDVPATEQSFAPQSPDIRPRTRPVDLIEQNERGQLGGFSRTELASLRPRLRPLIDTREAVASVLAEVETEEQIAEVESATELAVVLSPAPSPRPNNIATIVQRAQDAKPAEAASSAATVTQVAAVAPRTVTPKIPTTTSVAREATVKNALNLRQVNLMGVAGKPSARRALVRMPNGRISTVKVGDRIDGGRVVAIGEGELRYKKGSRNLVLKMPKG